MLINDFYINGRRKRRGKIDIIANILLIAQDSSKKTQIMYDANLSFQQLKNYLKNLTESGLLVEKKDGNSRIYKTTEKGKEFLKYYINIRKILSPKD